VEPERPEFREFFSVHYEHQRRLGYLLSSDWGEAEELAQDALVRTFAAWPRINPEKTVSYARQVLVNRHRSRLRRALAQARHAARLHRDEGYVHDSSDDRLLLWAVGPPEAEVARLLHLPLGTAKSLARRGLGKLRRQPALARPSVGHSGHEEVVNDMGTLLDQGQESYEHIGGGWRASWNRPAPSVRPLMRPRPSVPAGATGGIGWPYGPARRRPWRPCWGWRCWCRAGSWRAVRRHRPRQPRDRPATQRRRRSTNSRSHRSSVSRRARVRAREERQVPPGRIQLQHRG
jgi:DNA-directed RNA polymerase specialized sigma24 family protein